METLDFVLIVSLSLLSVCFIVFLAFFIPVLIQLARVFDSLNTILVISKDSLQNVVNKVTSASSKAEQLGQNISQGFKSILAGITAGAKSFFTKR
ncbi:MAG: hypothetical protein VKK32_04020 [Candidatus Melainabacteria bacterium]|jgi:hypothetical protein|nr:hypothetical protein [Candidatus Melainabacteria bacterium]NBV98099.1 hypothetical protein [Pseudomonadota bacterium]